jgi:GxxExxY protein
MKNFSPVFVKEFKNEIYMDEIVTRISRTIWDTLGPGYSESVYHTAFEVALRCEGIKYETERIIPVMFLGQNVGHVRADIILDGRAVIELKSTSRLTEASRIQIRNYMKLLGLTQGWLINFPDKNGPIEIEDHTVRINSQ